MAKCLIRVRVFQTCEDRAFYRIVEKGVLLGGRWTEADGTQLLTMFGSGTSGILRFQTEQGKEGFYVAMGVHNNKPWVDTVVNNDVNVTGVKALPEYYGEVVPERNRAREAQRTY